MGTRADFYAEDMTWLGSIGWDGYPDGLSVDLLRSTSETTYRANLERFLAARDDVTLPEQGWPWPWDDSGTTDYAYVMRDGALHASSFGRPWFRVDPQAAELGEPDRDEPTSGAAPEFPDMAAFKNVRYDRGSGLIVLGPLAS